jgi:hypothetical protein
VVAGERGDCGLAALCARGAAGAHVDPVARHDRRRRLAARIRARPVLRRGVRAAASRGTARARARRQSPHGPLELLHDGAPLGRLPGRRARGLSPLDALELLREVRLLRQAGRPARARQDDRLARAPPADAVARLGRAAPGRLRRGAQPPGSRRDGVRPPRHAVLAPVPRLLQRRGSRPREQALDQRRLARAAPARLR